MKKLIFPIILLAATLQFQPAEALTYYCKFAPDSNRTAIPPDLLLEYDEGKGTATVIDGFIQREVGEPIAATLRSKNGNRYLFGWAVPGVRNEHGQYAAGFTFSLNILRASGAAQISAQPQGYRNSWRGDGQCEEQ